MESYEQRKVFGIMSKSKSMHPLTKRHKIINVKKASQPLEKGRLIYPTHLRALFFSIRLSRQASTPSLRGPATGITQRDRASDRVRFVLAIK